MDEALYTFSTRGQRKLVQDGYDNRSVYVFYNRDGSATAGNANIVWRCDHYLISRCKVTAITKRVNSQEKVQFYGTHNHPPKE